MTKSEEIRLSEVTCSDRRMDILDTEQSLDTPVNSYVVKCGFCSFPDMDIIPDPYYLYRVFSGIEIMIADLGNLLVSDRVKKVLEVLFPGVCTFNNTFILGTRVSTGWWLAIPVNMILSGEVNDEVPRCGICNEPLHAHPGSQYKFWNTDFAGEYDIVKAENWYGVDEFDWKKSWISRAVFLSVRLISLLKRISAKGIHQQSFSKYKGLTKGEKDWVEKAIVKIGSLARFEHRADVTADDLIRVRRFFNVKVLNEDRINSFQKKFMVKASELVKIICSIDQSVLINTGFREEFSVEEIQNWQSPDGCGKLTGFAFDSIGNCLFFDPKDKLCPLYHYDHETMIYELIHSTIIDII
ncbi:hypothetical protein HDE69_001440 [Pedobacter cryoconitis]|uniref:Uncharacterized protein n=1 Tax=Pedobacter cryoconitis TaxID=188932 RepID=A0A7W9DIS6_9SPHI|nr:hypothetical protein [Pedobacter cryoconitis]MBB5620391.1 hypothetical protein [Pedobacter cryoconitis]